MHLRLLCCLCLALAQAEPWQIDDTVKTLQKLISGKQNLHSNPFKPLVPRHVQQKAAKDALKLLNEKGDEFSDYVAKQETAKGETTAMFNKAMSKLNSASVKLNPYFDSSFGRETVNNINAIVLSGVGVQLHDTFKEGLGGVLDHGTLGIGLDSQKVLYQVIADDALPRVIMKLSGRSKSGEELSDVGGDNLSLGQEYLSSGQDSLSSGEKLNEEKALPGNVKKMCLFTDAKSYCVLQQKKNNLNGG